MTPPVSSFVPAASYDVAAVQRRTMGVLVASQALGGLGTTVGVAVAAVLAEQVSGRAELAGLVQTMQVLGAAAASFLIAGLMGRRGRRVGLVVGYGTGAAGAALCVVGGAMGSFPVLLLGAALLGSNSASNYQARYAAADLAKPQHRAGALATVLWATTFGAVLGPNLTGPAGRLAEQVGLPKLTGPFLVSVGVTLLALGVLAVFLRPDPLLVARKVAGESRAEHGAARSWSRAVAVLRQRPQVLAAVVAMASAHAVMVSVMVMTPLHMDHGGATLQVIGLVISIHVLGMYFFAPLVGWVADRTGRPTALAIGALVLFTSLFLSGTSPTGASVRIGVGLFLLGVGWSFCTVAASTLLTEHTPLAVRTDVQGVADLVMNLTAAVGGAAAGVVVGWLGFPSLNLFAALLTLGVVVAVVLSMREPLTEQ